MIVSKRYKLKLNKIAARWPARAVAQRFCSIKICRDNRRTKLFLLFELTTGEFDRNKISIVNKNDFFPSVSTDGKQVSFSGICEEIEEL